MSVRNISKLELHYCPCFVCHSDNQKPLFLKKGWQFVSCNECGFIYVNPRLSEKDVSLIYKDSSWFVGLFEGKRCDNSEGKNYLKGEIAYIERAKTDIKNINRYIYLRGTILDIGCGVGHFLSVAKSEGWDVYGVEISPFATTICKEKGLNVFVGTFSNTKYKSAMFDVITAFDVLEHVIEPNFFLQEVFRILKKGGLFVVSVPNVDSFAAKIKKDRWSQFIVPEHLNYFSSYTMKNFLTKHNFKIVEIYSEPSVSLGVRKFLRDLQIKPIWVNQSLNKIADYITLFKKHIFYPPINKITKKYNIEANLLVAYAIKTQV